MNLFGPTYGPTRGLCGVGARRNLDPTPSSHRTAIRRPRNNDPSSIIPDRKRWLHLVSVCANRFIDENRYAPAVSKRSRRSSGGAFQSCAGTSFISPRRVGTSSDTVG